MKKIKMRKKPLSLAAKNAIGIFLSIMICTAALLASMYSLVKRTTRQLYEDKALQLSQTMANVLTSGNKPYSNEEWDKMLEAYSEVMNAGDERFYHAEGVFLLPFKDTYEDIKFMYIQRLDTERDVVTYLADMDTENPYAYGDEVPFTEANRDKSLDEILLHPFTSNGKDGWLCSSLAPIAYESDTSAIAVGVDISMELVRRRIIKEMAVIAGISLLIGLTMALLTGFSLNRTIIKPVTELSDAASCYDSALLLQDVQSKLSQLNIHTGDEIETLSSSVQKMEREIKQYVMDLTQATAANERIGAELNIAANIQSAMLPRIFPAFPDRDDFDLYATMHPAKEVGGDFYDFFLLDYDHLAFIAADVSGKGVPAALFMVIAKTLIRNQAQFGLPPEKVFTKVNMQLCEHNDAQMFVTAWMGILELSTGKVVYSNAGHTHPAVIRRDGSCEYIKVPAGFVLAGMEMMQFKQGELQLSPGDTLFLYTDGVTEATNTEKKLFGEAKLLEALDGTADASPQEMIGKVKASIDGFVKDAPQFDDITMLAVKYKGEGTDVFTETRTFVAVKDNLPTVTDWLEELLSGYDCPMKLVHKLNISAEEIFINIANYAYPQGTSTVDLTFHYRSNPRTVQLTFTDKGIPYDPLKKRDPDVTLGAEERKAGGLGIYMVKQYMDDVSYRYEDGRNILTLTLALPETDPAAHTDTAAVSTT